MLFPLCRQEDAAQGLTLTLVVQGHTKMQTHLSDTNIQMPLITPQNWPLGSTLPVFIASFMPPRGPGLSLGRSASVLQLYQGMCTHDYTQANVQCGPR